MSEIIKDKKQKIFLKISFFCFAMMEIYVSLPIATAYFSGTAFKIIFLFISILALLSASLYSKKWLNKFVKNTLFFVILYILIVSIDYLMDRYSISNDLFSCIDIGLMYVFLSLGYFFVIENNKNINTGILIIFMLCLFITLITTIRGLAINPNYSRMLSTNETSSNMVDFLRKLNIRCI